MPSAQVRYSRRSPHWGALRSLHPSEDHKASGMVDPVLKKIAGGVVLLGVGHISGQYAQSWYMKKRFRKAFPLIQDSLVRVVSTAVDNDLDRIEIARLMDENLQFINLAMGIELED